MIWSIRERRAFERLARRGSRIRTSTLWCTYLLDPAATPPRVAFAIGRNVGRAVIRNRIRRQLRAVLSSVPPPPGWFLIGVRSTFGELTFVQRQTEWQALIAQLPLSSTAPTVADRTAPR